MVRPVMEYEIGLTYLCAFLRVSDSVGPKQHMHKVTLLLYFTNLSGCLRQKKESNTKLILFYHSQAGSSLLE